MISVRRQAVLLLITLLLIGVPSAVTGATQQPAAPYSLAVTILPQRLPADGNTYPAIVISLVDFAGLPTVALNDTNVLITSSLESVGSVQSSATIRMGRNFVTANFTTTKAPGTTSITTTSLGLQAASAKATTVIATGYPTHLSITAVPDTAIARPNNGGGLIVQLQDDAGLPAKAIADTAISLYSSNTKVVNVSQPSLVIRSGDFIQLMNYTTGFVPGSATITASATGYNSGSAPVNVLGLAPLALKLYAQPNQMMLCILRILQTPQACTGRLVVSLTDTLGNPTRAPRAITVQIRSSSVTNISAPQSVTINAGDISAITSYTTNSTTVRSRSGSAIITVSAPGLQSDFATITTYKPVGQPYALKIFLGPTPVLADHRSYSSVVVSLLNKTGFPTMNPTGPIPITLTSSVTNVGNFSRITMNIPQYQNYNKTSFTSTFLVGSTSLTASAQNLISTQAQLQTFGSVPSKVVIKAVSPILPADGVSHPALQVMLQDAFGSPAVAPFNVPVSLSSSQSAIAQVSPVTIKNGQTFAFISVRTGTLAGKANITAAVSSLTSGYTLSSVILQTVVPAPSALAAYALQRVLTPIMNDLPLMAVQLQDANGNPARARAPIDATITSSNTTVIPQAIVVHIPVGGDYALTRLSPKGAGITQFTVSGKGLASAGLPMTVMQYPLQVSISTSMAPIFANQTTTVSLNLLLDGKGLPKVAIIWTAVGGTTSSPNSTTDLQGHGSVVFAPGAAGLGTVTAAYTSPAFGTRNLTASIPILATPAKPHPSLIQLLLSFPYVLFLGGGIAGGIAASFLIIRRRRRPVEGEEEGGLE